MNYGASSYSSTSIGGSVASQWYVLFPRLLYGPDVLFESRLEFTGSAVFFSLFSNQNVDTGEGVTYKAYTSNDPDETPQLQTTFAGIGQAVIGAARFIKVTAEIDGVVWAGGIEFSIRGRIGD